MANRRAALTIALGVLACSPLRAQDAPTSCADVLKTVNPGLRSHQTEALLGAATLHETGRCVGRDDVIAAQYLGEAARAGSRPAALRLGRKFGRGSGVAQSYANAGAWITGKGASDEPIEPWDYSIGYASTLLAELLDVNYPSLDADQPAELSFVVEINALKPAQLVYRMTSAASPGSTALSEAVERLLRARLARVQRWVAPADARWLVNARVAVPVTLSYASRTDVTTREADPILR